MDYTHEVLQLLYSIPAKSRQGRLACIDPVMEGQLWKNDRSKRSFKARRARAASIINSQPKKEVKTNENIKK